MTYTQKMNIQIVIQDHALEFYFIESILNV